MPTGPAGEDKGVNKPQQPELARSGRGEVDPAAAKTRRGGPIDATPPVGAVPQDNLPGHKPNQDQDKPEGPPPRPKARKPKASVQETVQGAATATITERAVAAVDEAQPEVAASFKFDFDARVAPLSYAVGVTPWTTGLEVRDGKLRVRFGVWSLTTPLDNVVAAEVTGPYAWLKVAGPPRLSLADRGITFATSTRQGVCIKFRKPVSVLVPFLKHPGLTVTVDDAEGLAARLGAPAAPQES